MAGATMGGRAADNSDSSDKLGSFELVHDMAFCRCYVFGYWGVLFLHESSFNC